MKTLIELRKMMEALDTPEKESMLSLLDDTEKSLKRRKRILDLLQEALGQLRLDMKYLVFDLECTRRERDALKQ